MAGKKELLQALVRGIRQDLSDYGRLQALLAAQRQLMLGRDNAGLLEHNREQDALVTRLRETAANRSQLLTRIGVSADAAGMERLLRAMPAAAASQINSLWQQLLTKGQECEAANEQNGRLLVRQQELIQDLLNGGATPADSGVNSGISSGYPQV